MTLLHVAAPELNAENVGVLLPIASVLGVSTLTPFTDFIYTHT